MRRSWWTRLSRRARLGRLGGWNAWWKWRRWNETWRAMHQWSRWKRMRLRRSGMEHWSDVHLRLVRVIRSQQRSRPFRCALRAGNVRTAWPMGPATQGSLEGLREIVQSPIFSKSESGSGQNATWCTGMVHTGATVVDAKIFQNGQEADNLKR